VDGAYAADHNDACPQPLEEFRGSFSRLSSASRGLPTASFANLDRFMLVRKGRSRSKRPIRRTGVGVVVTLTMSVW
jgi:hypothetical protein